MDFNWLILQIITLTKLVHCLIVYMFELQNPCLQSFPCKSKCKRHLNLSIQTLSITQLWTNYGQYFTVYDSGYVEQSLFRKRMLFYACEHAICIYNKWRQAVYKQWCYIICLHYNTWLQLVYNLYTVTQCVYTERNGVMHYVNFMNLYNL